VQFFSHSVELSVFKTFGTPITKTIGHQRVFLFCHLTYFVQLLYLGKLRDLNIMNLALRRWFSQSYNTMILNTKLSLLFYLLIIHLSVY